MPETDDAASAAGSTRRTSAPNLAAGPAPPGDGPVLVSVARFLPRTRAEGPGERTAIWVQGCTIRCPGCFNPHMWNSRGGTEVAPDALAAQIIDAGTTGVTLLGGEPFDQATALAQVAARLHAAGRSVMTFTGYPLAQLHTVADAGRRDVAALLDETDLIVAGPFLKDRIDVARPWIGSTNQELAILNDRFPDLLDDLPNTPDRLEISVDACGRVAVNGWAGTDVLDALLRDLDTTA